MVTEETSTNEMASNLTITSKMASNLTIKTDSNSVNDVSNKLNELYATRLYEKELLIASPEEIRLWSQPSDSFLIEHTYENSTAEINSLQN